MLDKMKALLEMQQKMQAMKRQLQDTVLEIKSPDGIVRIAMSGTQELKDLTIQGDLKQLDKAALEKALKDAYNRAVKQAQELAAGKMRSITGLDIPGLI